jgi:hypothetical protein
MKTISSLHNKYINSGKSCLILGCGASTKYFVPNEHVFTIGVNDIGLITNPNVLLLVDYKAKFEKDWNEKGKMRTFNIEKTNSDYYVILDDKWNFPEDKKYFFKLGEMSSPHKNLIKNDNLDYAYDSPYMAVNLAYKMGFRNIGLLGVDFCPNHFYENDGDHQLVRIRYQSKINQHYRSLHQALILRKASFYNLSEHSILDSISKIKITDFYEIANRIYNETVKL